MTNLLIAHPQNLHVVDLSYPTESSDNYYYYNLLGGPRAAQFKRDYDIAYPQFEYKFDMATTINSVFIGSASEIINDNWSAVTAVAIRVVVDSSDVPFSMGGYITRFDSGKIDDFMGTMDSDYVATFTSATAKYWRVWVVPVKSDGSTTDYSEIKFSKLFLCEAVDLGREPYSIRHSTTKSSDLYSVDGNYINNSNHRQPLSVDLAWKGLTDAELESFLDILDVDGRGYIALFNPTENLQLANTQCIYGKASGISHSKAKAQNDYNYLSFTFNEQF